MPSRDYPLTPQLRAIFDRLNPREEDVEPLDSGEALCITHRRFSPFYIYLFFSTSSTPEQIYVRGQQRIHAMWFNVKPDGRIALVQGKEPTFLTGIDLWPTEGLMPDKALLLHWPGTCNPEPRKPALRKVFRKIFGLP